MTDDVLDEGSSWIDTTDGVPNDGSRDLRPEGPAKWFDDMQRTVGLGTDWMCGSCGADIWEGDGACSSCGTPHGL